MLPNLLKSGSLRSFDIDCLSSYYLCLPDGAVICVNVLPFSLEISIKNRILFFFFCREERFIPISSNGVHPRGVIWHRNRKCLWGKRAGELRKGHCDHRQLSPRRSRSVIGDECTSIANSRVFPSPAGKAREAAIGKIVKDLSVSSFILSYTRNPARN